jgi:hypothetical protein
VHCRQSHSGFAHQVVLPHDFWKKQSTAAAINAGPIDLMGKAVTQ